ncbi:hypothetical protein [Flammeovirga pacifica]|uniref:Uncharacterized protein n=1 Tax=Flammeovirga pacifica TaxID=915059 RepID=A0A1S1YW03_FLAPC|nr:hypothetical protein [Flammeovirga pacifica]OHX65208.1 hypothetical protein NH26_01990 [Flammeovirga pacifica]
MKTIFSLVLITIFSFSSFANVEEAPTSDKMSKLIKMVNKADKDDWQTLNKAASFNINWNADLELAKQWLDASIQINDNPEAYELIGDYHLRKGDMKKAYNYYHQALLKGVFTLNESDFERIQRKTLVFGQALNNESKYSNDNI